MKKITLIGAVLVAGLSFSQTFSDNFDSYTAGEFLALQSAGAWTTWSNSPGGTEDALVSNANASSGANSVYFTSSADGGGPVDQVKQFGVLNTGQFSLEWNMFVETGKAAYFNLQKTAVMGNTYSLNANFNDDGSLTLDDASAINLTTSFTQNVWFNFRIDINFNTNHWELFIDDVSKGSFSNSVNQVAAIDIYPVDQNTPFSSGFYVDDFQYTITPYTLPNLNAALTLVSTTGPNLAGLEVSRKVKVRNLGLTTITSFDINCNYNGIDFSQSFTSQNIASLAEIEVSINQTMVLVAGSNNLTATISNVNGNSTDDDANDNSVTKVVNPVVPALGKMVVGEEGTGTWCPWCVRGTVFMDKMETLYEDYWAGIAVHNGDPMVVADYDSIMGTKISGYPSSLIDRGPEDDPSMMEPKFLNRIAIAPTAYISNSATWDSISRILTVTVSANFQTGANNNYKLACVLTEDNVSKDSTGYAQANAYAGGGNGEMGGFESLPSSVPAAQMVYDHVARKILPGFYGLDNSFPATVGAGETHSQTFTFSLNDTWKFDDIHIIGILISPDGTIDNAGKISAKEAISNSALIKEADKNDYLTIFPNPTKKELNIQYTNGLVDQINIITLDGKTIFTKKETSNYFIADVSSLKSGMYIVEVISQNSSVKKVFIKE
jgi:hypothetical protein